MRRIIFLISLIVYIFLSSISIAGIVFNFNDQDLWDTSNTYQLTESFCPEVDEVVRTFSGGPSDYYLDVSLDPVAGGDEDSAETDYFVDSILSPATSYDHYIQGQFKFASIPQGQTNDVLFVSLSFVNNLDIGENQYAARLRYKFDTEGYTLHLDETYNDEAYGHTQHDLTGFNGSNWFELYLRTVRTGGSVSLTATVRSLEGGAYSFETTEAANYSNITDLSSIRFGFSHYDPTTGTQHSEIYADNFIVNPEPSTILMFIFGIGGLAIRRFMKKHI